MYKRTIVIGCPGSGKSVLSKQIAGTLELPLYHLDMIWHKPDKTTISKEEFDARLDEILEQDTWLIDGNYQRTLEKRIAAATAIVFLDLPTELCLKNAKDRIGKPRDDIPWIETELDPEFEKVIIEFKDTKRHKIYELLDKYNDGTRIIRIFRTRAERRDFALNDLFGFNIHD
ncbi:MAG: adenylate kinase [Agathobacter sp.]|nr:adenylate kinase [Agathobacter sp.]